MVKKMMSVCGQGLLIAFAVILMVCPLSCKMTAEGVDMLEGDYTAPKMAQCLVLDERHVELDFSENVKMNDVSVSKKENEASEGGVPLVFSIAENDNNGKIVIEFENSTEIGASYIISGVVEDSAGNSLTFSAPFSGYNGRIPKMIITETHTKYAQGSRNKIDIYRCEYIELMALEDGNVYGLVLGSATNGPELDYYFPVLEVKKGERIIVHFNAHGEGCISEEGDDLSLSTSEFCLPEIRDLWIGKEGSAFSDSYDAIYLKDSIHNKFMDGFMYIDSKKTNWNDEISEIIKELIDAGIFKSGEITDACKKEGNSALKAFRRLNIDKIYAEAEKSLADGKEIVIPQFSKDDWTYTDAKPGNI